MIRFERLCAFRTLSHMVEHWRDKARAERFRQRMRRREELGYDESVKTAVSSGVRFTFRPYPDVSDEAAQMVHEAVLLVADCKQIPESLRTRMVEGGMDPNKADLFKTPVARSAPPPWLFADKHGYDHVNPGDITVHRQRDDDTWEAVKNWEDLKAADRRKALQGDAPIPTPGVGPKAMYPAGEKMIRPTTVEAHTGHRIWLEFSDGTVGEVDLSYLAGKGVFVTWDTPGCFESVRLGPGASIAWGDDIELCPVALYMNLTGKTWEEVYPDARA